MPRRKKADLDAEQVLESPLAIPAPHKRYGQADPHEPMKTGVITGEAKPIVPVSERRAAEDLSQRYARALVANSGDIVEALMATFRVSREEAMMNMAELHDRARATSRVNTNMTDMMERHDLTMDVRLAKLRELQFHENPAVALKAIDTITELDSTAKSKRTGTSWEVFLARARSGAGPKARNEREAKRKQAPA